MALSLTTTPLPFLPPVTLSPEAEAFWADDDLEGLIEWRPPTNDGFDDLIRAFRNNDYCE